MPLVYLKNKKKYTTAIIGQKNMGGFMKGILVKRLESSFHAFRMTLDRFILSYEKFINILNTGEVYISKKVNVYDLLDDGNLDRLMELIEQNDVMRFKSTDFEMKFIKDLESDLASLKSLRSMWNFIKNDPKLEEFKKNLFQNKVMKGKKIIVFTESKETASYLYENLQDVYGERVVYYSGQSSPTLKVQIEDSFNPKNKSKNNDRYDLLITTDVLAEGINLHRANVLINYDLPWNPTRIMQRVGRINRVGTEYDRIYVFNFFPTAQSHSQIPLEDRILEKLQAFHDTLGEDFKYLSEEEEVSSQKLFDALNSDLDENEERTNPELAYLAIIREIRDSDPKLFETIKKLPKKAKAGKMSKSISGNSTVSFIRKGALKTFFISDSTQAKRISFIEALSYIQSEKDEKKISVSGKYYSQLKQNDEKFDTILTEEEEVTSEKVKLAGNDAKVIKMLKALRKEPRLTEEQENKINYLIVLYELGEIPSRISKEIVKKMKQATDTLHLYFEIMGLVPSTYFEEKKSKKSLVEGEKQVILSCYLKSEV